ncbi:MAG TPA: PilZ domain-containing protein [Terriglobales bacterium]|nr:PilZ domain-containing protein [Terriglobales bacterium]
MTPELKTFPDLRRSTRVPLQVSIEVEGDFGHPLKGTTAVVNLHGALIMIVDPLPVGSHIKVTVYITSKSALARVVYVAPDNPLKVGIELEKPQNIWGVPLPPADWEED